MIGSSDLNRLYAAVGLVSITTGQQKDVLATASVSVSEAEDSSSSSDESESESTAAAL
jgi:hypothetical protein